MLKYLAVAAALSMGLTFASSPAKAELIYVFSFLGGEVSGEIDLPDTCSPSCASDTVYVDSSPLGHLPPHSLFTPSALNTFSVQSIDVTPDFFGTFLSTDGWQFGLALVVNRETAPTTVVFLSFAAPPPPGSDETEALLIHSDQLTITAVPEPSTWAMLLIGFAGIGFLAFASGDHFTDL